MKYCTKCVMPDTRPGITFNSEGVCSACLAHEAKKKVDWDGRFKELQALCDKYRGMNGDDYDCMIAVGGGKDSHYQVHLMKNVMKFNTPLLVYGENVGLEYGGADAKETYSARGLMNNGVATDYASRFIRYGMMSRY